MRALIRVVMIGVLALLVSGCWPAPGAGPDRRSFNPFEQTLTSGSVGNLTEAFRVPLADGAGPPVVEGSGLFVRSGLTIRAFAPDTGVARWSANLLDPSVPTTTISDPFISSAGTQVFASVQSPYSAPNQLVTLASDTGSAQRQSYQGQVQSLRDTKLGSAYRPDPEQPNLTLVSVRDLRNGSAWGGLAPEAVGGGVASLGTSLLYVATGNQVLAYNPATPCLPNATVPILICYSEWARPLQSATTPVVIGDDSTVYVASASGVVFALKAATGGERWDANVGAPITKAPALANGILYVGSSDGRLSAIAAGGCGQAKCPVLWSTSPGSAVTAQPAVAGGIVYTGSADGSVKAFPAAGCGAATCAPVWSANAGSSVDGGLAVEGGHLYAGTHTALVGYRLASG
jgi:outer membrane protein assembly factor BamB